MRPKTIPGLLLAVARIYLLRLRPLRPLRPLALLLAVLAVAVGGPRLHRSGAGLRAWHRAHHRAHADGADRAPWTTSAPEAVLARLLQAADENEASPIWPVLVANGSGYGLAWVDGRNDGLDVYFARFSPDGQRLGPDVRVTEGEPLRLLPRATWTGQEYGLVWTEIDDDSLGVSFARVSAAGQRVGTPVRLSAGGNDLDLLPDVAWNGREFGVAWHHDGDDDRGLWFARVTAGGEREGAAWGVGRGLSLMGMPNLAWGQREYAIAFDVYDRRRDQTTTGLLRVGESGREGTRIDVSRADGLSTDSVVTWDGQAWGLAWQEDLGVTGRNTPCFARASASGVVVGRRPLLPRGGYGSPHLVATAQDYGVAWTGRGDNGFDVYFARVSRAGEVLGAPVRVSATPVFPTDPSLAWNGREYALAWLAREGDAGSIRFARVSAEGARVGPEVPLVKTR